jgi:hypothetical protein
LGGLWYVWFFITTSLLILFQVACLEVAHFLPRFLWRTGILLELPNQSYLLLESCLGDIDEGPSEINIGTEPHLFIPVVRVTSYTQSQDIEICYLEELKSIIQQIEEDWGMSSGDQ